MELQIQRALQDAGAMTEFLKELEPFVYRVCYHLTGHQHDAEDLAQDSLMKVCRNLHTYRGDCAIQSWVYRIILNTQRDAVRKKKNVTMVELSETASTSEGFETQVNMKMLIQKMLGELTGVDRQIFILRFVQDLPLKEVASLLEMKEATVKTRLFRLRDRLKGHL
ncbi:RNA polymerase sigma factor [Tumebacillus avium]|uniref:RNA polymerase sigma factor n=1 Tax=Tumebacillus avium TaxID=1903704 RepID=UPI0012FD742F|nr:RNA polymerase sigma factor [Tumebacillus avium]